MEWNFVTNVVLVVQNYRILIGLTLCSKPGSLTAWPSIRPLTNAVETSVYSSPAGRKDVHCFAALQYRHFVTRLYIGVGEEYMTTLADVY
jgi:hypothetical protein